MKKAIFFSDPMSYRYLNYFQWKNVVKKAYTNRQFVHYEVNYFM